MPAPDSLLGFSDGAREYTGRTLLGVPSAEQVWHPPGIATTG